MKEHRPLLLILAIMLSAFVAFGLFTMPHPKGIGEEGFSSARAIEDLKVIAREPHSVAHPTERNKVLEYLTDRLEALGGNPQTFVYPNITARKFTFDAKNVLAEFPPLNPSDDNTYLMMIAHYDSRYPWKLKKDTVVSKGAADDGYGLAIILESIRQALKYRDNWHQGIKVLFTDAEEVDLQGMKAAYKYNKEIFEDVGLIVNMEARGPYGPALLFETSDGNGHLMNLYADHARYPFAYSLTNMVYQQMPNGTDFNIVRDSIPGFNFSPIADINHYHTELDNIYNVSEKTIQHYGEQIAPIIKEYLTNGMYADKHYFMADEDAIYFSIPLLGMFTFSKSQYWLLNIGVFLLFLHQASRQRNLRWKSLFKQSLLTIVLSLIIVLAGEMIAWLSALIAGARFKLFGTIAGIPFDNAIIIFSLMALIIRMMRHFRYQSAMDSIIGSLFTLTLLSLIFQLFVGENMIFFIPLCIGTLSLTLWQATSARVFPLLGMSILLIHAFSFIYILAMALTIGALGIVLFVAFFNLMILIPLANAYLTDRVSSQTLWP